MDDRAAWLVDDLPAELVELNADGIGAGVFARRPGLRPLVDEGLDRHRDPGGVADPYARWHGIVRAIPGPVQVESKHKVRVKDEPPSLVGWQR